MAVIAVMMGMKFPHCSQVLKKIPANFFYVGKRWSFVEKVLSLQEINP